MYRRGAMIYAFDDCRLDLGAHELTRGGRSVPLERQVFSLLALLIENRDRLVRRDEIVERVWAGRVVSEAAISSRIKSARAAVGDDGQAQRLIRTHHGLGFRFVGEVSVIRPSRAAAPDQDPQPVAPTGRPSIAVLPFSLVGVA